MVEVKEPFIAERAAEGPARRPRRVPGGAPSSPLLKREPCWAQLCPGPGNPWLGCRGHTRCPAAPHISAAPESCSLRGRDEGCAGLSLWGDAALGCAPLPGDGAGGGRETLPLAFCCPSSPLLRRAGSLRDRVPASYCQGSLAAGLRRASAKLVSPLPSALMQRARAGVGGGAGAHSRARTAARPLCPRCRQSPYGCRDRRCAQVRGLPLAPIPPGLLSMPGHHAPLKYNLPGNNQRAAARAPELLAMQIAGGEAAPLSPRSHF